MKKLDLVLRVIFALFITGAAFSELTRQPAVVQSAQAIQMPYYIMYILGVAKIAGAIVLVFVANRTLKEWAYAGFFFNLTGAIIALVATNPIFPDVVIAPIAWVFLITSYYVYKTQSL